MSWYAIRTIGRQEGFVAKALTEEGLIGYVPQHITEPKFARRKATRSRPLIPGYVFAHLPDDDAIQGAYDLHGVVRNSAIHLQPKDVGALVLAEAFRAFDETYKPPRTKGRRFKPGEHVRVVTGHLEGREALVLRTKNKDRLDVLLTIFGRDIEIEVEARQLATSQDVAFHRAA